MDSSPGGSAFAVDQIDESFLLRRVVHQCEKSSAFPRPHWLSDRPCVAFSPDWLPQDPVRLQTHAARGQ